MLMGARIFLRKLNSSAIICVRMVLNARTHTPPFPAENLPAPLCSPLTPPPRTTPPLLFSIMPRGKNSAPAKGVGEEGVGEKLNRVFPLAST